MKNVSKKPICMAIAAAFLLGSATIYAATTPENVDDASALGTAETPQIKQQEKQMDKKSKHSGTNHNGMKKNGMHKNNAHMKMMDKNNDGMVSKDEYMQFHEGKYNDMKPGDGGVSYKNSMNNKPLGTTSGVSSNGSVDVTKEGPINGTTTGTN